MSGWTLPWQVTTSCDVVGPPDCVSVHALFGVVLVCCSCQVWSYFSGVRKRNRCRRRVSGLRGQKRDPALANWARAQAAVRDN